MIPTIVAIMTSMSMMNAAPEEPAITPILSPDMSEIRRTDILTLTIKEKDRKHNA